MAGFGRRRHLRRPLVVGVHAVDRQAVGEQHREHAEAAEARTVGRTSMPAATWPQAAAPAAAPPISAIWYTAMPRARTQSGSVSCAATVMVLAVRITQAPGHHQAWQREPHIGRQRRAGARHRMQQAAGDHRAVAPEVLAQAAHEHHHADRTDAGGRQQCAERAGAAAGHLLGQQRQQRHQTRHLQHEQADAQHRHLQARRLAQVLQADAHRADETFAGQRTFLARALPAQDHRERQHRDRRRSGRTPRRCRRWRSARRRSPARRCAARSSPRR